MQDDRRVLYIKGERNIELMKETIMLGDILRMECSDREILSRLRKTVILKIPDKQKGRYVLSIMKVIEKVHEFYPDLEIISLGEPDMIITYKQSKKKIPLLHELKTAAVVLIIFFGAAFSIMAFNNDVDVTTLFGQIYELVTGEESSGFTILEITYSIGISVGILVFFNHFGKRKFTADPTPMEIQMRMYENDIQSTLVEESSRMGEEIDVAGTDASGNDRT